MTARRENNVPVSGRVILETERLLVRELDESDVAAYYLLGSDPAIIRYTRDPNGGLANHEHALQVLRSHPLADYRQYGFGRWACVEKSNHTVIGFAGFKFLEDLNEIDIGYRFLPIYWGRGLATEAGRAIIDYGFDHLKLERIIGLVDPENKASARVLKKLGLNFIQMFEYRGMTVAKYVICADEAIR